ncbi:MAG: ABC transporter permease subunit [Planctomycetota bacterium]|jgi:ABC-type transport system involved in multi-copper enzyme maturation permease subunit
MMATKLIKFVPSLLSPARITGPIFDKELRVSSRRRRNYVLRFCYVALLTLFVILMWREVAVFYRPGAFQIAWMSEAGKAIVATVVWFQFCATQLVAIVMLSTSISDEIYNRTLGLLMTTPINSFQIVMGKLLSKLLQLILLLAISLPLLAIVRIFGGVPWDYIVSSLCITLTVVIFVGSLSLLFSIFSRRAYVVIIMTILTLGVLFGLLPFLSFELLEETMAMPDEDLAAILFQPNPYAVLAFNTEIMMSPQATAWTPTFYWPLHCGIILAASAVLLSVAVNKVRVVALRQATGQLDTFRRRGRKRNKSSPEGAISEEPTGRIRRVNGSPAIWRELRTPMLRGRKVTTFIVVSVALIVLLISYLHFAAEGELDGCEVQTFYIFILGGLGTLFTIVLPATCITSEKESRSWPLLLATTLSDWQILFGKFLGVLRRCLPVWIFMFGHLILFTVGLYIHPIAVVHLTMLVAWVVVFLLGSGLYFSASLKHTTSAVVANFALALVLWAVIPLLLGLATTISHDDDALEAYVSTNPMVQAIVIMVGAGGSENAASDLSALDYDWPHEREDFWLDCDKAEGTTAFLLITMLAYISFGFLFAWRAKCRFRRNVF